MPDPAHAAGDDISPTQREMLKDAIAGLTSPRKTLPSKYLYDEEGSRLFDEITELDEYYPTRTEAEIMRLYGPEMAEILGPRVLLIEYGSGSSAKTCILLDHMRDVAGYVPVDISGDYLSKVARQLQKDYPHIPVLPVAADFTKPFALPKAPRPVRRRVVYFPGSTIGNFTRAEAGRILKQMAQMCGRGGGVLIGVDLLKPVDVLHTAYNDARGVTAAFNLNLLRRLNNELDADFDLDAFEHRAEFNERESRIEMGLVARREQQVELGGASIHFDEGESILTEYSHKYTVESFGEMAASAGLRTERVWKDSQEFFSVQYLERVHP